MTPWAPMLRRALAIGIAPEAFWRVSLKEWRALTEPAASPRLDRKILAELIARFPDDIGLAEICND